jgi:methylated-DNA-protein-cysteine methyltransferase-like protein
MIQKESEKNNDFFYKVYEVVKLIPPGRVTSYGAIANYLGTKRSSRMVGWALNNAHRLEGIPAHRVVNRNGLLTGKFHFENHLQMEELLKNENIQILDDKVVDFKKHFWDPTIELEII